MTRDRVVREQHKSKLNLLLEDISRDLFSILENLREQSVKEISGGAGKLPQFFSEEY